MELSVVLGFAALAFTLIAVPGPDWAYVLAAGSRDHVVTPVVGGILIGYALITAMVVAGVGPLMAAVPMALVALTLAGAGCIERVATSAASTVRLVAVAINETVA